MSCLSLVFWEDVVVRFIILIAVTALLRVLIAWFGGGPAVWWPPVRAPWTGTPPQGGVGIVAAVLEILIWVAWALFFVYLIFALIGCLLGAGTFHIFPRY